MQGVIESGSHILAMAERRTEIAAQNIANAATHGYRRLEGFAELLAYEPGTVNVSLPIERASTDFTEGRLIETGGPLDLALVGDGFFVLRFDDALLMTRHGQFTRNEQGQLVGVTGGILQLAGGGDAIVEPGDVEILTDGTILNLGLPVGRLAIADVDGAVGLEQAHGGLFATPDALFDQLEEPQIRQGMLESSNVSLGQEMVAMMEAMRRAETGQRLIQTYDAMLGRAITAFGQSS